MMIGIKMSYIESFVYSSTGIRQQPDLCCAAGKLFFPTANLAVPEEIVL